MGFKKRNQPLSPLARKILGSLGGGPKTRKEITAHLRTVPSAVSASREAVRGGIGELLSVRLIDKQGQRAEARFATAARP